MIEVMKKPPMDFDSLGERLMSEIERNRKSNKFTCSCCGKTFNRIWTKKEALKEKDELFPDVPIEHCAKVCDDCFKEIMDFNEPGLQRYNKPDERE